MLDSCIAATPRTGVFLTSYRSASLVAVATRRAPVAAERLVSRTALAATAPSLAGLIPSIGEKIWDYQENAWVGQNRVHSRGFVIWCRVAAGSGGSQGWPWRAVVMASMAVMPCAAAESR